MLAVVSSGCAHALQYHLSDRACVSGQIDARFGKSLGPNRCPSKIIYPNGISLESELTEDAAIILALWNNAAFLEQLTDYGIACGDLVQAGLLPNPELVYFFPVSDKPIKYAFDLPIEAIWLRPIREAAAARELDRVGDRLTQSGLDLIRDVRQTYADTVLARQRLQVAGEALQIRSDIAKFARIRLDAGDISPQEAATALIDASRAEQDQARIAFETNLADERLRFLMGTSDDRTPLELEMQTPEFPPLPSDIDQLVAEAVRTRPDALAAAQFAAAAAERLRLTRIGWVRFLGILDATSGVNGHEFGPAFRVTLPLLNWNQGNIARAEAELEKAERQRQTVHNQIVLDVQQSQLRYAQGQAELKVLNDLVRPETEKAISRSEKAYKQGNTTYVVVLQTATQLIDARYREVQLHADLRRAWADLERSVGRHLEDLKLREPELLPTPATPEPTQDADSGQPQADS